MSEKLNWLAEFKCDGGDGSEDVEGLSNTLSTLCQLAGIRYFDIHGGPGDISIMLMRVDSKTVEQLKVTYEAFGKGFMGTLSISQTDRYDGMIDAMYQWSDG
jgi:hypothetical protein